MRIDVNSDAAGDDVGVTRGQRKPASEAVRVAAKLTADCHDGPIIGPSWGLWFLTF